LSPVDLFCLASGAPAAMVCRLKKPYLFLEILYTFYLKLIVLLKAISEDLILKMIYLNYNYTVFDTVWLHLSANDTSTSWLNWSVH
jgi:hypothetical protein